jgi:hypothetical protein
MRRKCVHSVRGRREPSKEEDRPGLRLSASSRLAFNTRARRTGTYRRVGLASTAVWKQQSRHKHLSFLHYRKSSRCGVQLLLSSAAAAPRAVSTDDDSFSHRFFLVQLASAVRPHVSRGGSAVRAWVFLEQTTGRFVILAGAPRF